MKHGWKRKSKRKVMSLLSLQTHDIKQAKEDRDSQIRPPSKPQAEPPQTSLLCYNFGKHGFPFIVDLQSMDFLLLWFMINLNLQENFIEVKCQVQGGYVQSRCPRPNSAEHIKSISQALDSECLLFWTQSLLPCNSARGLGRSTSSDYFLLLFFCFSLSGIPKIFGTPLLLI
jgi:hypothetical protein